MIVRLGSAIKGMKVIFDFYDNNSKILHSVVESNNIGEKEERAIVISYLIF